MNAHPDGEVVEKVQLSLDLFRGEPWDGMSPRALTRGRLGLILKPEVARSVSVFEDILQLELWPIMAERAGKKVVDSFVKESVTAPTLLPLPYHTGGYVRG